MKNIVEITGVPLVRVAKINKLWYVQQRENESTEDWLVMSEPFQTKDEALDEAPVLCGF